jgi:hypothetical protein
MWTLMEVEWISSLRTSAVNLSKVGINHRVRRTSQRYAEKSLQIEDATSLSLEQLNHTPLDQGRNFNITKLQADRLLRNADLVVM